MTLQVIKPRGLNDISEAEFLTRIKHLIEHADSLVYGLWMAAKGIEDKSERDAIRDMAHYAGEHIGEIVGEVRSRVECFGKAEGGKQ